MAQRSQAAIQPVSVPPAQWSGAGRHVAGGLFALLLLALIAAPGAAVPGNSPVHYGPTAANLSEAHGKVSTDLLALADDRFLLPNQSHGDVVSALAQSGHYVKAGKSNRGVGPNPSDLVEVYIRTDPGVGTAALRPYVHRITAEDAHDGIVAAWVAPDRILDIADAPSVREVRPVLQPCVRTGSVTSAGDVLLRAAEVRSATGLSGEGVRVGVISDGVDHWTSARATGDLPANLGVLSNTIGGDEGTAMLEVIHDIAPNATLLFHDCGWNVLEFNAAVDELADAGCRVIVDDIGWVDEPFFEDGVVAAHAEEVMRSRGVVYISAAGNDGNLHYQGLFRDDGTGNESTGYWHDFSGGESATRNRLYVTLPPGDSVMTVLEWSEPFGEAGSNYDLALYDTADRSVPLAAGSRVQNGDDDPIEVLTWINAGGTVVEAEIDIFRASGAAARTLEVFVYPRGGATLLPENTVAGDSIYGHPAAAGVVAVAAIDSTDPTGSRIEPFSSRGPVTLIASGDPRPKPDCSGVDGVRVTGAGSFPTGFWGTSAAAPHAAGLAALIWSGRQDAPATEVRTALRTAADDLGAPGADSVFGAGRLNGTAMQALFSQGERRPSVLPGRIEAEDYDHGGEGVGYHDNESANLGGTYRPGEGVDIEPFPGAPGYHVGYVRPGEWLRYSVIVPVTGTYPVRLRGASSWGRPYVSLLVDEAQAAVIPIASTGSYDTFALTNGTVNLTAGEHRLRLVLSGYFDLDYIEFGAMNTLPPLPGAAGAPRDLDGDGRYDDVNGNGRVDFADITLYFNRMDWIAANEPIPAFDYNGNGRIDFADVTALFATL